jgi:phosphoribosylformylglycinamidine synthase subunit PurS
MPHFTVRVFVTLKPSVFDPQGRTIVESLHGMGYGSVSDVRQGKYFEVQVEAADGPSAETLVREVSGKLLANPVIESFRLESPAPATIA